MIDSSYLVASDPNSMRDNGPTRNAQYYFPLENLKTEEDIEQDHLDYDDVNEGAQTLRDHSAAGNRRYMSP